MRKQTLSNEYVIRKLIRAITHKYKIGARLGRGFYTDVTKRVVYYPKEVFTMDSYDALSLIMHEIGHIVFTTAISKKCKTIQALPDKYHDVVAQFTNVVEDIRIDYRMIDEYENGALLMLNQNEIGAVHGYINMETLLKQKKDLEKRIAKWGKYINDWRSNYARCITRANKIEAYNAMKLLRKEVKEMMYEYRKYKVVELGILTLLKYYGHYSAYSDVCNYYDLQKHYNQTIADRITDDIVDEITIAQVEKMENTKEVLEFVRKVILPLIKKHIIINTKSQTKCGLFGEKENKSEKKKQQLEDLKNLTKALGKIRGTAGGEGGGDGDGGEWLKGRYSVDRIQDFKDVLNYDKHKQSIKSISSVSARKIGRVMKENAYMRYGGAHRTGKLNTRKLYKTKLQNVKVFERKQELKNRDYAVALMVDISGSMLPYERARESIRGMVLFSQLMELNKIPYQITFISTEYRLAKEFNKELDKGHFEKSGLEIINRGTNITPAYDKNINELQLYNKKTKKIMILFTDGDFTGDDVQNIQEHIKKHKDVLQYGIGIQTDVSHVFGTQRTVQADQTEQIVGALSNIMRKHIKKMA